jgi:hypothetical protein
MGKLCNVAVLTLAVSFFSGCGEDETPPTAPGNDAYEFVATVQIDPCGGTLADPVDELCGGTHDVRASFEYVLADIREEFPGAKAVTFRTGPGTWEFSHHGCGQERCRLSDSLHDVFAGRPLMILARRPTSPSGSATSLSVHVLLGDATMGYDLFVPSRPVEMSTDADGFPVIDDDLALSGDFGMDTTAGTTVGGSGDMTIRDWRTLPVHHKPEPPVVGRPTFTVQQLRNAPASLTIGEYTVAFRGSVVFQSSPNGEITVSFSIWEQGLWDFDQARLDFLWVVRESGEIWEPEIPSVWDSFRMDGSAGEGPAWAVGTLVDIVVGFVDLNGDVRLMGATEAIVAGAAVE